MGGSQGKKNAKQVKVGGRKSRELSKGKIDRWREGMIRASGSPGTNQSKNRKNSKAREGEKQERKNSGD